MGWIDPVSTVVTAASLAKDFASSSKFIRKRAKRIIYRIQHGKAIIPVFGAGGAGKTTLARILLSKNPLDAAAPYDESCLTEPVELEGDGPGLFLVAPGQPARAKRHWPDLIKKATKGKCFGIINVVSYGCHSFMVSSYKEDEQYEDGMSPDDFFKVYTRHGRDVELNMLKMIEAGLTRVKRLFGL